MNARISVKWNGREVQNPVLHKVVGTVAVFGGLLALCWGFVFIVLLCMMSPLLIILHFILKAIGRRGFVTYNRDGSINIDVSSNGFRKV